MLQETLQLMPLWAFVAACGVTLVAGFVKGAIGFAMPLVMISGLSLFLDPLVAVAGIVLPIVMSNLLQVMRYPWAQAGEAFREYWRYILIVCVMIVVVAQFVMSIPTATFYLILGVPVVILSLIQLIGVRFHMRRHGGAPRNGAFAADRRGAWRADRKCGAGPHDARTLSAAGNAKAKQMLVQGVGSTASGSASAWLGGHLAILGLNTVTLAVCRRPFWFRPSWGCRVGF